MYANGENTLPSCERLPLPYNTFQHESLLSSLLNGSYRSDCGVNRKSEPKADPNEQNIEIDNEGPLCLLDHRKKGKGNPVVLRPTNLEGLRHIALSRVYHALTAAAGEHILRYIFSDTEALTIEVSSEEVVSTLLGTTAVASVKVMTPLAAVYIEKTAIIKSILQ